MNYIKDLENVKSDFISTNLGLDFGENLDTYNGIISDSTLMYDFDKVESLMDMIAPAIVYLEITHDDNQIKKITSIVSFIISSIVEFRKENSLLLDNKKITNRDNNVVLTKKNLLRLFVEDSENDEMASVNIILSSASSISDLELETVYYILEKFTLKDIHFFIKNLDKDIVSDKEIYNFINSKIIDFMIYLLMGVHLNKNE